jgi:transcriptional regulator with XRE-family HTH domain
MIKTAKDEEDSPELKSVYLAIGQRIRDLREQRSFSQKELATRAGVRQPYLAEIELVGVNLSLRLLHGIAGALGVTLRDLLPGSGDAEDYETSFRTVRDKIHHTSGTMQLLASQYAELLKLVDGAAHPDKQSHQAKGVGELKAT